MVPFVVTFIFQPMSEIYAWVWEHCLWESFLERLFEGLFNFDTKTLLKIDHFVQNILVNHRPFFGVESHHLICRELTSQGQNHEGDTI